MISEICEQCHNTVIGEFTPSATRKWLTALAKKGGMKAVLTYAGSVIPGFGNIAGFLTGAAIDVLYGDNINKMVDKIADQFEDNKLYVFTCPQCGNAWTRAENQIGLNHRSAGSASTSQSKSNITNKVKHIIAEKLGYEADDVHLNSRLVDDLGADSLDSIELLMEFEKEFGLDIPDEDMEEIQTVGDVINYIDSRT